MSYCAGCAEYQESLTAEIRRRKEIEDAAVHFLVTFNNLHYGRLGDEMDAARIRLATVLRKDKNAALAGD